MIDTGEEFGLEAGQFGVADITIVFAHFILFGVPGSAGRTGFQRRHRLGRARQNADRPRPFLSLDCIGRRLGGGHDGDRLIGQDLQTLEHRLQPPCIRFVPISRHA